MQSGRSLTNTFWHYWCFLRFTDLHWLKKKGEKQTASCPLLSVSVPGCLTQISEWLPAPTLDMRTPRWCSARLCGWEERGRAAAGPPEPPVNRSCLMFAYRDTASEKRALSLNWNVNPLPQTTALAYNTRSIPATCPNTQRALLFPSQHSEFELWDGFSQRSRVRSSPADPDQKALLLLTCYKEQLSRQKRTSMCLSTCDVVFMQQFKETKQIVHKNRESNRVAC